MAREKEEKEENSCWDEANDRAQRRIANLEEENQRLKEEAERQKKGAEAEAARKMAEAEKEQERKHSEVEAEKEAKRREKPSRSWRKRSSMGESSLRISRPTTGGTASCCSNSEHNSTDLRRSSGSTSPPTATQLPSPRPTVRLPPTNAHFATPKSAQRAEKRAITSFWMARRKQVNGCSCTGEIGKGSKHVTLGFFFFFLCCLRFDFFRGSEQRKNGRRQEREGRVDEKKK